MIQLVVIDFDDTLSLTEETTFKIENQIAAKLGFAPMTRELHRKNWGLPLNEAIAGRIPGVNVDIFMKEMEKVLPDFVKDGLIDIVDDRNVEMLKQLKNEGKRLAILTSRTESEVKHLLDRSHHLNRYIEHIYHTGNSKYLKPDPRVFNQVFTDFKVTPENTVYIGDTIGDGIAAKGAGAHFIAVLESGLRKREDFASVPVDFFADTFPDSIHYIQNIK